MKSSFNLFLKTKKFFLMTGFEEFVKWFNTLSKDKKKQILIYLEYLLENDWYRYEILFNIDKELEKKLMQFNIVETREVEIPFSNGSANIQTRPFISNRIKEKMKSFISNELPKVIEEEETKRSLLKFITENEWAFPQLLTLSSYEIKYHVGEELMKIGLGIVKRWISWRGYENVVFEFRQQPFDGIRLIKDILRNIQEEKIKKTLNEVERDICLLSIFNLSDNEILINLDGIYPYEAIESALVKLRKKNFVLDNITRNILLNCYRHEISKRLQEIFQKRYFTQLGILLTLSTLGKKGENYLEVNKEILKNFKNTFNFLKSRKLLFEKGEKVIIPSLVIEEIEKLLSSLGEIRIIENKEDALNFLRAILDKAKKEVIIIDNYISPETVCKLIFPNVDPQVEIVVLTTPKEWKEENETQKKTKYKRNRKLRVYISKIPIYHDRYIMIDHETIWHLGGSIKDLGLREKYKVSRLPSWFVDDFYTSFEKNLEMLQKEGKTKYSDKIICL